MSGHRGVTAFRAWPTVGVGAWRAGAGIGRKVRGPSRHVNVGCIHGTVVIGEPKGLNQTRQDMKQGDPVIALNMQGVERTGASRRHVVDGRVWCRRRPCAGSERGPGSRGPRNLWREVARASARRVPARTLRPETFRPKPPARPWPRSLTTSCTPRLTGRRPPFRGRRRHDPHPARHRAGRAARGMRSWHCTLLETDPGGTPGSNSSPPCAPHAAADTPSGPLRSQRPYLASVPAVSSKDGAAATGRRRSVRQFGHRPSACGRPAPHMRGNIGESHSPY